MTGFLAVDALLPLGQSDSRRGIWHKSQHKSQIDHVKLAMSQRPAHRLARARRSPSSGKSPEIPISTPFSGQNHTSAALPRQSSIARHSALVGSAKIQLMAQNLLWKPDSSRGLDEDNWSDSNRAPTFYWLELRSQVASSSTALVAPSPMQL
jgi:hypothetical protein